MVPGIENGLSPTEASFMRADDLSILTNDNPRGMDVKLHGTPNSPGFNAVPVAVKIDQAGPRHGHGLFPEADKGLWQGRQEGTFSLEHLPDRPLGRCRMPKLFGAFDRVLSQPFVQFLEIGHFKPRRAAERAGFLDKVFGLTLFPACSATASDRIYQMTGTHFGERLVELARLARQDRVDAESLPPVWHTHLSDNATVAEWLTHRIHEIDRMVQKATTIAVLVNEEKKVEPLALELNRRLEEINLSAVPCKDGKVIGNDRDVRVFNIRHIKGLEFEAVFFVDLDQTIFKHPDLFSKYLYVGATRAATYLGATLCGDVPKQIKPLSHHFGKDWSL